MSIKKIGLVGIAVVMMAVMVGAASAQEAPRPPRAGEGAVRELVRIVAEETGLELNEILADLQEGMSLADIITANGGNVDTVIGAAVTAAIEKINEAAANGRITQERADQLLGNLEDVITRGVNGDLFPQRRERQARREADRILMQEVTEATGLRPLEIARELRGGSTLADVITANGGDVNTVIASAVAAATKEINAAVADGRITQEQADELLAGLEPLYTDLVNGNLLQEMVKERVGDAVLRLAAEKTGLNRQQLREQLLSGQSLADVLSANGVDVNGFIDEVVAQAETRLSQAVTNGRLTQERADTLLNNLRERLTERINTARTPTV